MVCSEVLLFLFQFSIKTVGSGPTCQLLVIRYAHPTGRPSDAAQTTLCYSKKSNQKCRKLNGEA
jgi:hypothetical protein